MGETTKRTVATTGGNRPRTNPVIRPWALTARTWRLTLNLSSDDSGESVEHFGEVAAHFALREDGRHKNLASMSGIRSANALNASGNDIPKFCWSNSCLNSPPIGSGISSLTICSAVGMRMTGSKRASHQVNRLRKRALQRRTCRFFCNLSKIGNRYESCQDRHNKRRNRRHSQFCRDHAAQTIAQKMQANTTVPRSDPKARTESQLG